jgi:hypothetical protein
LNVNDLTVAEETGEWIMKQSFWILAAVLAVVSAFACQGFADDSTEFVVTRIAPDVIVPEKIGQEYFSRHTVMGDQMKELESPTEKTELKTADEKLQTAKAKRDAALQVEIKAENDQMASSRDLEKSDSDVNATPEQKQKVKIQMDKSAENLREAQDELKMAEDQLSEAVKARNDLRQRLESRLSIILNSSKVDKIRFSAGGPSGSGEDDRVFVRHDGSLLDLWLPYDKYSGHVTVRLGVDDKLSRPYDIVVSRVVDLNGVGLIAAVVTIIVFGVPIFMISRVPSRYTINGRKCSIGEVLLLEQETDTYSLSKFQFLWWTLIALFGYVFLTIARTLVQGTVVFADLPANFPGIIAISVGAGVLGPAAGAARGAKGAGPIDPTWADFVTSGGVVAPERFQFFVWTLVGGLTFLFLILSSDPCAVKELPAIPPGFLQLMGISSLGYLGGKLVRKPGPIIDSIVPAYNASTTPPKLTLTINGRKLSRTARFTIEGGEVETAKPGHVVTGVPADADEQDVSPDLYKKLILEIDTPKSEWTTVGSHKLQIINPDGQNAEWPYTIT